MCYLRSTYTFNKLSGPKTSLCLLWCLGNNPIKENPKSACYTDVTIQ